MGLNPFHERETRSLACRLFCFAFSSVVLGAGFTAVNYVTFDEKWGQVDKYRLPILSICFCFNVLIFLCVVFGVQCKGKWFLRCSSGWACICFAMTPPLFLASIFVTMYQEEDPFNLWSIFLLPSVGLCLLETCLFAIVSFTSAKLVASPEMQNQVVVQDYPVIVSIVTE